MPVLVACAIGVAVLLVLVWASARSAITIAVAEIREGKVEITRGGLAPRVLGDLRDVASRPRITSATVRIVRAKDRARVEIHGDVSEQQVQRLRNVIGTVPVAQLMKAKPR
jgi:Protein of unknown function (DUF3634)